MNKFRWLTEKYLDNFGFLIEVGKLWDSLSIIRKKYLGIDPVLNSILIRGIFNTFESSNKF